MQFVLTHHNDPGEMRQIQHSFSGNPKFLFLYHSIKFELDRTYPSSTLQLYSCSTGKATYWFASRRYRYVKVNDVFLAYEGEFDAVRYAEILATFADISNIFVTSLLFVGEKALIEETDRFAKTNMKNFTGRLNPTLVFYMTEAEMENVKKLELPPLPEGYDLDSSDPVKDSEIITSYWRHAKDGDIGETNCIRHEGKPVAFEMLSQSGSLTHLFVVEEHRGKGFGQIVELDLCQKAIRFGVMVHKYVELFNKSLIDSTSRLPYWIRAKQSDGEDYVNVFYELDLK